MTDKTRYILGALTITAIIGGTIYVIKKAKDHEKAMEEAITLEEAQRIVAEHEGREVESADHLETATTTLAYEEEDERPRQVLAYAVAPGVDNDEGVDEIMEYEEEDEDENEGIDEHISGPRFTVEPLVDFRYIEEGINPKEDDTLRYDPNSDEAKHQFIRMELADWNVGQDEYTIFLKLFEVPFIPNTEGDEVLRTQIIDHKVEFFGFNSKWNREVSFADVVLHYARLAAFNCGDSVSDWGSNFLYSAGFKRNDDNERLEVLTNRLNSHTHYNPHIDRYGLFGITIEHVDEANKIASRNIEKFVTYEIEFNEFLKQCMEDGR